MSIFDSIKSSMAKRSDKKKEEKEMLEKMQFEADVQRRIIFQEEFKKNALEVARAQAKKQAASASGLQKLRAENRARRLTETNISNPNSFLAKVSEFTQKNIAKRQENMKRTEDIRKTADEMKKERLTGNQQQRVDRINRKSFGQSSWKM